MKSESLINIGLWIVSCTVEEESMKDIGQQILKYSNESGPFFFMLDVTSACNFRCLHCYNESGIKKQKEMTNEELVDVALQIADFHPVSVCLCGGEPMLRSNLVDLVKIISPNAGAVNMVSNGSLITEAVVKELKEAGINTIQISLDGVNSMQHDTFRCFPGAFEKAINALKIIHEQGVRSYVSFIPNKLNIRTFSQFLDLMVELNVEKVRMMPLIPMGRGSKIENLILSSDEYVKLQSMIEFLKYKYSRKQLDIEWGDPLDHLKRLPNNDVIGYKNCQYSIKSNGDITISPYLPIIVGNIRKHSLKEYWINGYNNIWYNKKLKEITEPIETLSDINELYNGLGDRENYCIDIMNDMVEDSYEL